jgi:hypothetical protein
VWSEESFQGPLSLLLSVMAPDCGGKQEPDEEDDRTCDEEAAAEESGLLQMSALLLPLPFMNPDLIAAAAATAAGD